MQPFEAFGKNELVKNIFGPICCNCRAARILIISGADSRGIFDKIIHFNTKVGQLVVRFCTATILTSPGRQHS